MTRGTHDRLVDWPRSAVWTAAIAMSIGIAAATVWGFVASGSSHQVAVGDLPARKPLFEPGGLDQLPSQLGWLAVRIAALVLCLCSSAIIAIRLAEHRWPWPIGPRVGRRSTGKWSPVPGSVMIFFAIVLPQVAQPLWLGPMWPDGPGFAVAIVREQVVWIRTDLPQAMWTLGWIASAALGLLAGLALLAGWRTVRAKHATEAAQIAA